MMKSQVDYSILNESYLKGQEIGSGISEMKDPKIGLLYTSCNENNEDIIRGIKEYSDIPVIGMTSNFGVIVPDGIVTGSSGFAAMMTLDSPDLTVGVACHEAGKNPRAIGRRVAIEAVENAKTTRAPSYFYMVATPNNEEEYLQGIQDVIGRVPLFGGSAADDNLEGDWKIICNNKVITDGVAVAFFYTDTEIVTSFTGDYEETDHIGIITKVENDRSLLEINGNGALKEYASWINQDIKNLEGRELYEKAVLNPIGIKNPIGSITLIRQPLLSNDRGTKTTKDDSIELGNKIVEKTAIIGLETTLDNLILSNVKVLKDAKRKLYNEPAAYILMHSAGRRIKIDSRIDEVYKDLVKETKGVPFIMPFTCGEYGYDEHSANMCGGLMLSFTIFGKE